MNLELLKRFYAIAQEKSVSRAAQKMNIAQSAVTQSLLAFEQQMQAKLFDRKKQGMVLTPQGERLYEFADRFLQEAHMFEKKFRKQEEALEELRVMTLPFGGVKWLIPSLKEFLEEHPTLTVRILLSTHIQDLTHADVFICPFMPHGSQFIQKHLYTAYTKLFASPTYLHQFGEPTTPAELSDHRLIAYESNRYVPHGSTNWILNLGLEEGQPPREAYFEVNSLEGILTSIKEGYGIGELPDLSLSSDPEVKRVLPHICGPDTKMYYTFLKSRQGSKKINLLFEYLSTKTDLWIAGN